MNLYIYIGSVYLNLLSRYQSRNFINKSITIYFHIKLTASNITP